MGGSALSWSVGLSDDLVPGSFVQLELTMRKFGPPDVEIAWDLRLVDPP
ncbi:MAG: hypothetical protein HKN73_12635 [Gemmatimonadetes bacterium]|nr:hypothetical protein [Gemmatimonadota bacterium]